MISPILANIYLHYVLDLWSHQWRQRKSNGDMIIIRYADDTVFGFEHKHDAQQFLCEMTERLQSFDLTPHPNKTQLIRFGRYAVRDRKSLGKGKPKTFDFLGFTHFCTHSGKSGVFIVGRKTIKKRMRVTLQLIKAELRKRWHDPISKTGRWIQRVLQGHQNYFSVSGNDSSIWLFYHEVQRLWLRRLRRRSQKAFISWNKFIRLTARFFPRVRLIHPLPCYRFDARTRGRSPVH